MSRLTPEHFVIAGLVILACIAAAMGILSMGERCGEPDDPTPIAPFGKERSA